MVTSNHQAEHLSHVLAQPPSQDSLLGLEAQGKPTMQQLAASDDTCTHLHFLGNRHFQSFPESVAGAQERLQSMLDGNNTLNPGESRELRVATEMERRNSYTASLNSGGGLRINGHGLEGSHGIQNRFIQEGMNDNRAGFSQNYGMLQGDMSGLAGRNLSMNFPVPFMGNNTQSSMNAILHLDAQITALAKLRAMLTSDTTVGGPSHPVSVSMRALNGDLPQLDSAVLDIIPVNIDIDGLRTPEGFQLAFVPQVLLNTKAIATAQTSTPTNGTHHQGSTLGASSFAQQEAAQQESTNNARAHSTITKNVAASSDAPAITEAITGKLTRGADSLEPTNNYDSNDDGDDAGNALDLLAHLATDSPPKQHPNDEKKRGSLEDAVRETAKKAKVDAGSDKSLESSTGAVSEAPQTTSSSRDLALSCVL
jgi:hypothetical protein